MFGESDSESPRVPSPWDSFITPSPSPSPAPGPAPLFPSQLSTNVITAVIRSRSRTPSPLANELVLLPKLVPESDDGNVEYKLQLLNPTHSRFLRLVTQLKWRLLEGGGQAYYELGVADSGDLIGLPRDELEQSLDTLDMMAGEIGASVIVVKEIEIPAVLATLARRNAAAAVSSVSMSIGPEEDTSSSTQEEDDAATLGSLSGTDHDEDDADDDEDGEDHRAGDGQDYGDMSATVVLEKKESSDGLLFAMDPDADRSTAIAGDREQHLGLPSALPPGVHINVEIASVFKPRPGKKRHQPAHSSPHLSGRKGKRAKKHKHLTALDAAAVNEDQTAGADMTNGNGHCDSSHSATSGTGRAQKRRLGRDRRREEKRKALESLAAAGVGDPTVVVEVVESNGAVVVLDDTPVHTNGHVTEAPTAVEALVHDLDSLHVGHVESGTSTSIMDAVEMGTTVSLDNHAFNDDLVNDDDDDDVFGSPRAMTLRFPAAFPKFPDAESHLHVDPDAIKAAAATAAMTSGVSGAVVGDGGSGGGPGHDGDSGPETRLIVEVLVVWKMPLEDQFLDFEGWIS